MAKRGFVQYALLCLLFAALLTACGSKGPEEQVTDPQADSTHRALVRDTLQKQLKYLDSEHGNYRKAAVGWLAAHPQLARPPLDSMLRTPGGSAWSRGGALQALAAIGHPGDVPLLDSLFRYSPGLRAEAGLALAANPNPQALALLTTFANDPDQAFASDAIVALGERKDEGARPVLEALLSDTASDIRFRAAYAIERMGAGLSINALRKQLTVEPDSDVKHKLSDILVKEGYTTR